MAKKDFTFLSIFKIFAEGIKLYLFNFEKFTKYMAFPVLGQIAGIGIIFTATYLFTLVVPKLTMMNAVFDNILFVFLLLLLITLPGFFIFCKAFWDYLIAMASLNSMSSFIIESKNKLEDTGIHDGLIKRRVLSYILFLLLISVIFALGSFPLLWGLFLVVFVFISLSFQVFALEEEKSPVEAVMLSINLVKYNFLRTALLLVLLGITTYWIVPSLICWGLDKGNIAGFFSYPVERFITLLPINELNSTLMSSGINYQINSVSVSKEITLGVIGIVVTAFLLPLRSLCCTMLFKELFSRNYAGKIAAEQVVKRAKNVPDEV